MADIRLNSILAPQIGSTGSAGQTAAQASEKTATDSFSDVLSRQLQGTGEIKFSRHAQSRLESRSITLGSEELSRLCEAVDKAAGKGVQDSLVVMDKLAFIVSVPDKTVVTAMSTDDSGDNVFTNIDGAVIA